MILKRCPDCGVEKALEEFPLTTRRGDGRHTYCRPCMNIRSRASYRKRAAAQGRSVREPAVPAPAGRRRCPDCQELKALEDFPRNKNGRDGRASYCKPCHNSRTYESRHRLHGGSREYHLRRRYGITSSEVDALIEQQGGLCAICRERPPQHVDHDHVTGRVRGVLCSCCNQALGNARDRTDILRSAIDYLERTTWQKERVCTGVYRLTTPRPAAAPSPSSSELQRLISSRRG